jgi:hypothetical protein
MFKKYTIANRINITLALLAVFFLVLGTNRIDNAHFETAQNALYTVHNDRVLAQDYLFKINNLVHKKKINYLKEATAADITVINKELEVLINTFSGTQLTTRERKTFSSLKENFETLKKAEDTYFKKTLNTAPVNLPKSLTSGIDSLHIDLNKLALIQVSESKNITNLAQKSLDANQLMSNMEIFFLLLIGIVVQFFIFYRTKKSSDAGD